MQSSELSRPLLGLEHEDELHDEEVGRLVPHDDDDDDDDCYDNIHTATCCDSFILWLVLPVLLFVQFGIAFRLDQQQTAASSAHHYYSIHHLEWSTVNYSILLFVLSSYLFRRTLQETESCCDSSVASATFMFLLPEIIMDILLAFVLFGQVVPAFLSMVVCTMGLSLYVVLQSFSTLVWEARSNDDESEEE